MILISLLTGVCFFISFIFIFICFFIYKKSILDREKMSSFECGFDPFNCSRYPFSMRFFLLSVIFLIFDVEIGLFLPILISKNFSFLMTWFISLMIFIVVLIWGLYHEWYMNSLDWTS